MIKSVLELLNLLAEQVKESAEDDVKAAMYILNGDYNSDTKKEYRRRARRAQARLEVANRAIDELARELEQ